MRVFTPGSDIDTARIRIIRRGVNSLVADVIVFGRDGGVVAQLEGLRLRALHLVPPIVLERHGFYFAAQSFTTRGASEVSQSDELQAFLQGAAPEDETQDSAALLVEAATHQAIWSAFREYLGDEDICRCAPTELSTIRLLDMLEDYDLATSAGETAEWQIAASCDLPSSDQVALALLSEHPDMIDRLGVLLHLPAAIKTILAAPSGDGTPDPDVLFGREALRNLERSYQEPLRHLVAAVINHEAERCPEEAPLQIGVFAEDPAAPGFLPVPTSRVELRRLVNSPDMAVTPLPGIRDITAEATGCLDFVVISDATLLTQEPLRASLREHLAPTAKLLVLCTRAPSLLQAASVTAQTPCAVNLPVERAQDLLAQLGRTEIVRFPLPEAFGTGHMLIAGCAQTRPLRLAGSCEGTDGGPNWQDIWTKLFGPCEAHDGDLALVVPEDVAQPLMLECRVDARTGHLASALLALRDQIDAAVAAQRQLVVVLPNGAQHARSAAADPLRHALWAMLRTAANEYPAARIMALDPAAMSGAGASAIADRLRRVFDEAPEECELVLTPEGAQGLRVSQGVPSRSVKGVPDDPAPDKTGLRLVRPVTGRLDDLTWLSVSRPEPGPGEVEIEIAATGLNYRDVMWAMGLLPEEALETGFVGPTLGLECAGIVSRIGEGVTSLAVGDRVLAFGPSCFSSHICSAEEWVKKLPAHMSLQQAASLPVACFTAYYGMVTLGHLCKGETILIHGGAGGVGLAAIALAQQIGANVIATAGSPVKQALLRKIGVEHVLSSRSTEFASKVQQITDGRGVDMVLNSLAGPAMEQSLGLLRPFGRFLELGKQDYYANTMIGLRALKDNISYFGVDIDSLVAADPARAKNVFAEVMSDLDGAQFSALPYTAFDGESTIEAFRLMQRSGHIGKIVVAPPSRRDAQRSAASQQLRDFRVDPERWHVVAGGLGGLGFETAQWLRQNGAKRIALLGRRDQPPVELSAAISGMRAGMHDLRIIACDITDRLAVEQVLSDLRGQAPLASVFHAAMVLEDRALGALDLATLERTLPVKTVGLRVLDLATREDELDAFVAFTTLAVMIGNPGQSAYVAANAYQEALMQARSAAGLPALALALGAITDAGYLTRDAALAKRIDQMSGNVAFPAASALRAMQKLLSLPDRAACVTITPMRWTSAAATLRTLKNPSHAVLRDLAAATGGTQAVGSLRQEIEALPHEKAVKRVAAFLKQEIATILRVSADSLSVKRPVAEFGMDSLMGIELGLTAQNALGDDLPLLSMADDPTIERIAELFVSHIQSRTEQNEPHGNTATQTLKTIVAMHGTIPNLENTDS